MTDMTLHPLAQFALTFAIGALAGAVFMAGVAALGLEAVSGFLDMSGGGLDARDVTAVLWIAGQLAVFIHHIVPGMLRA